MQEQFKEFISKYNWLDEKKRILLAISGGIDSMCMLHLFLYSFKSRIAIAHINHKTRNGASDEDEKFVRAKAEEFGLPYFSTEFNHNSDQGNFQEAARNFRYKWLSKIAEENDYQHIATAHHKNDSVESFIFNWSRSAGLDGLSGISSERDMIIRPLMFASLEMVQNYAKQHAIDFVEDESNESLKYSRNLIRHKIVPELLKLPNSSIETYHNSIKHLEAESELLNELLLQHFSLCSQRSNQSCEIDLQKLLNFNNPALVLFKLLRKLGFNYVQCEDILNANSSGQRIMSETHHLYRDRSSLVLTPGAFKSIKAVDIYEGINELEFGSITVEKSTKPTDFQHNNKVAFLNIGQNDFPLKIRSWLTGDSFYPLGLGAKKSLKEFFIDQKISVSDKKKMLILEANGKICWILGLRIDDRFKLTSDHNECYRIEYKES